MAKLQRLHEFLKKADAHSLRVAVIGLGYVGLPLLLRFSEGGFPVIGIDRSAPKIDLLQRGNPRSDIFRQHQSSASQKPGMPALPWITLRWPRRRS